jgi:CRISPR-associated exonuclease Cas4
MEESDDLVPLSALQHYLYCPRQCALIHVERLWAENRHTAEGRLLHDRADTPHIERRHGVRTITAMPLSSVELGIAGVADVVERRGGSRGRASRAGRVQAWPP